MPREYSRSQESAKKALARRAVVLEGFVYYIPSINTAFEMAHYSKNMFAHALLQHLGRNELAVLVVVEPRCALRVPDKAVPLYFQSGGLGLVDKLVSQRKVIYALLG